MHGVQGLASKLYNQPKAGYHSIKGEASSSRKIKEMDYNIFELKPVITVLSQNLQMNIKPP